jgi:aminoglycoside 6'-N-acetyltransferase I
MLIRPYAPSDLEEWRRMRWLLWPDQRDDEMNAWRARIDAVILVAERPGEPRTPGTSARLCGFAEAGARAFAEGCTTAPVAYLEGWWVDADVRRQGVGSALLHAVEDWARAQGHRELGSDADIDNRVSHRAHERLGFTNVGAQVLFRKDL